MAFHWVNLAILALAVSIVECFPERITSSPKSATKEVMDTKTLSPVEQMKASNEERNKKSSWLIEIKEEDIPDGALVYIVDESDNAAIDGETLQAANSIVFRPLFRYKQTSGSGSSSGSNRRKYYVPKQPYQPSYLTYNTNKYYYPQRYYK